MNAHTTSWESWLNRWFYPLLAAGILINITGLFVTILEPDGTLYATIAKTMSLSNDFVNLWVEGKDWLDKPHFPFWVTAISFEIFGINTFAYKFPALLFWGAGCLYTYRFARLLYQPEIAKLAILIYITSAHLILSNNDVRAEPYLTCLVIGSVYHFYMASDKNFSAHLAAGALLAGLAVMTKGPFILITIGGGFVIHWIATKNWKQFLHYRWWLALLLIFLFITPELYCLYLQFDKHPEKVVFNRTGVSGIRFFFWDSQFGRFFNTGPIKGKGDPFFYFHTLLWAFIPWSLLLYAGFINLFRKNAAFSSVNREYITAGASLVTFAIFSLSRFQLPHYIVILFPFFAVITARYLFLLEGPKAIKTWSVIQTSLCILVAVLMVAMVVAFQPANMIPAIVWTVAGCAVALYTFRQHKTLIAGRAVMTAIIAFGFINLFFYPELLKYQSGSQAAFFINRIPGNKPVYTFKENSYSFAFYMDKPFGYLQTVTDIREKAKQPIVVFTRLQDLDSLTNSGLQSRILGNFEHFHISKLKGKFIQASTRSSVTVKYVVAEISL